MPISRDLFEQEIDEVDRKILDLLKESPQEALSLEELVHGVGLKVESTSDEAKLMERLSDLEMGALIESRSIHGVLYFSII